MKKTTAFKSLLLATFSVATLNSYSQITLAKADEWSDIKGRTLIVQMLEEDPEVIADMEKKISKEKKADDKAKAQKQLDDTRNFIKNYNKFMKDAVTKVWDLNKKVEYKTISEVKALRKSKSKQYTVLFYSESSSNRTDEYGFRYFPDMSIPTLNYSRIEEGTIRIDYSFFMASNGTNPFTYADALLSLKLMKNHIAEIQKVGKKNYTMQDYAKDQGEANCKELKDKTIKMDKVYMHDKTTEADMKSNFTAGKLEFINSADVAKAIENEEDVIIGFPIPYSIAVGSMGPLTAARITFYRCFINVKTGKIITFNGTSMGDFNDQYFRPKEMRAHSECK
ncbi:MAG TPA: hypothetical protein VK177_01770 [Flavobacteriales bacterium]|nr:hypothetical protein [Flavobacteriales bacterium]